MSNQQNREIPVLIEAEQQILGAIIMNNDNLYSVSSILEPMHFGESIHARIFEAIQDMVMRGVRADAFSLRNELADIKGIKIESADVKSVAQYLVALTSNVVGSYAIAEQARGVVEMYNRRRLISIGSGLMDLGYDETRPAVLADQSADAASAISEVCSAIEGKVDMDGDARAASYLEMITKKPGTEKGRGIRIKLRELQTVLSERILEARNLYGLLSSSGEGKTSMTLDIIYEALMDGHPVQLFSFDQTEEQCVSQMVAQQLGLEVRQQKAGDLTDRQIDDAYGFARRILSLPFEVVDCDSTKHTVTRMLAIAKRFMKKHANGKPPLFIFDHMSAIPPEPEYKNSDEGTKALTKGNALKSWAKSLNAVCLVLQQRSGSGMKRFNPRPIPADLYGGEAARQPFDAIFYLFRAEEHMRRQLDTAKDEREKEQVLNRFGNMFPASTGIEGTAEVGTLKCRFGRVGLKRYIRFVAEYTKYESIYEPAAADYQEELI